MKRAQLRILLIVLLLVELWLLTGFLPQKWQESMYTRLDRIWPSQSYDYSRISHSNLDYELQPFKPLGLAVLAVLVVVNGGVIVKLWNSHNT